MVWFFTRKKPIILDIILINCKKFMMKYSLVLLLNMICLPVVSQELTGSSSIAVKDTLYKPDYPEGLYLTKEDFLNKKYEVRQVWPINVKGIKNKVQPTGIQNCYFYDNKREKITDVFAVSYKGHLYFQLREIFKNCNKKDRNETTTFAYSFTRVIMGGENYFYTEADLANAWAQGFAIGIGGVVGSVVAQNQIHGKGIVWDFKNQEFNIFKNCEDYNEFISTVYPEGVFDCENKHPDPYDLRKVMEKIK